MDIINFDKVIKKMDKVLWCGWCGVNLPQDWKFCLCPECRKMV